MKPTLTLLSYGLCLFPMAGPAFADGPGSLDKGFAGDGIATASSPINGIAYGLGIQPDGKILAIGSRLEPYSGAPRPSTIRLYSDGERDLTYGELGEVASNLSSLPKDRSRIPALALPDGGFLTGGNHNNRFTVERYQADGHPYPSFGSSGRATGPAPCDLPPSDLYPTSTLAVAIQPPWNRIIALVRPPMGNSSFSIGRLHTSGALDTTFGNSGWFTGFIGTEMNGDPEKMVVLPKDGTILVGRATTTAGSPTGRKLVIARLTHSGTRNPAYDKEVHDFGTMDASLTKLVPLQDGKVLACGKIDEDFFVMRLGSGGERDFKFGTKGIATVRIGPDSSANDMTVQADGKILLTGKVRGDGSDLTDMVLARFLANGDLDSAFGHGGKTVIRLPSTADSGNAVVVQADGKILVAGQSGKELAVLRLNGTGVADYGTWSAASGLAPEKLAPSANPAGDGTSNLMKFAFNLDATRSDQRRLAPGTGMAGFPSIQTASTDAGRVFRIEYLQRKSAGIAYVPMVSQSLDPASFQAMTGTWQVLPVNEGWDRVIMEMPVDPAVRRLFGRVQLIGQP